MNTIGIPGRLGRDASLKSTDSGTPYLNFPLANNIGYGDRAKTLWFDCTIWGKRAESLAQYLTKGTPVVVSGELDTREYKGRDGENRLSLAVNVKDLELMGRGSEPAQAKPTAPAPVREIVSFEDDEIPF